MQKELIRSYEVLKDHISPENEIQPCSEAYKSFSNFFLFALISPISNLLFYN